MSHRGFRRASRGDNRLRLCLDRRFSLGGKRGSKMFVCDFVGLACVQLHLVRLYAKALVYGARLRGELCAQLVGKDAAAKRLGLGRLLELLWIGEHRLFKRPRRRPLLAQLLACAGKRDVARSVTRRRVELGVSGRERRGQNKCNHVHCRTSAPVASATSLSDFAFSASASALGSAMSPSADGFSIHWRCRRAARAR